MRIVAVTMGTSYANWATSLYVTIWEDYVVVPDVPPASGEMVSAYIGESDPTVGSVAGGMNDDGVDDPHDDCLEPTAGCPGARRLSIVRKGSKFQESDKIRRWVGGRSEVGRF